MDEEQQEQFDKGSSTWLINAITMTGNQLYYCIATECEFVT